MKRILLSLTFILLIGISSCQRPYVASKDYHKHKKKTNYHARSSKTCQYETWKSKSNYKDSECPKPPQR